MALIRKIIPGLFLTATLLASGNLFAQPCPPCGWGGSKTINEKALKPQIDIEDTKTVSKHSIQTFKPEVYTHPDGTKIRVLKEYPKGMSMRDLQKQGYIEIEKISPTGKLPAGKYKAGSGLNLVVDKAGIWIPPF